jgi:asparagine synthase (glutamine-hydrolysing)
MSGIAVIHDATGMPVEAGLLSALLEQIAHRGSSVSTWRGEGIALGQRAPVATPRAHQERLPIGVAGGRFQVALDGRLDNRDDLFARLGPLRHTRGMTDSELIAMAYEKWGLSAPTRLIGDFAFVLWDMRERRLVAVRDQRGIRPLFYARHSRRLILGSEPRQLFAYPEIPRSVDALYFASHLTGARVSSGSTPYASIAEVPPGHFLVAEGGGLRLERYWRFEAGAPLDYRRDEEYVEHFDAVFAEAVAASLRGATKPAIVLSGALDSAYAAAVAAESTTDLRAIHASGGGRNGMEEPRRAREVAKHLGIPLTEVDASDCSVLSGKYLDDAAFDQPRLPVQAALMIRLALEAAGLGSTVLLDGVSSKELASGPAKDLSGAVPPWQSPARPPFLEVRKASLSRVSVPNRVRYFLGRSVLGMTPPWVEADTLRALGLAQAIPSPSETPAGDRNTELDGFWAHHQSERLPAVVWRERKASLPNGLETRSPFSDLRVLELASRMPARFHRGTGYGLTLLRPTALQRLPIHFFEPSDGGEFDEEVDHHFLQRDSERAAAALEGPLAGLLYVDARALTRELDAYCAGERRWSHALWRAVTGGLWLNAEECARSYRLEAPATLAGPRARGQSVSQST